MPSRASITVCGSLAVLLALASASPVLGALRSPQVQVLTGRLQSRLDALGESIHVGTDQLATQAFSAGLFSCRKPWVLQLELGGQAPGTDSIGIYDASQSLPARLRVFPAEAGSGWFAIAGFRSSPTRMVVNLFDSSAAFRGTTVYLGIDGSDVALWVQGPGGTFYMEDARNPALAPQVLMYAGTGINSGSAWLCIEDQQVGGASDQDYDDEILFLEGACGDPVERASWGELKARFR